MRLLVSSQYLNWEDKAKQYLIWWGKTLLARYSLSEQMRPIFYLYRVFGKFGISGLANFSQAVMTSSVEAWFGWHSGVFTRVSLFLIGWRSEVRDWWWLIGLQRQIVFWFCFLWLLVTMAKKKINLFYVGTLILNIRCIVTFTKQVYIEIFWGIT